MHFFAKFFELSIVLRSLSVRKKEINVVNGSKNIGIYLVQLSDEG